MNTLNTAFKNVVRGGIWFMCGKIFGNILRFLTGIILIRMLEKSDYGLISICTVFISIMVSFSTIGFRSSIPRFLSKYNVENSQYMGDIVGTSLFITIVGSVLFSFSLFFCTNDIVKWISDPNIKNVLIVLIFMITPSALIGHMSSIFRGIEDPRPHAFIENIGLHSSKLLLFITVFYMGVQLQRLLFAIVISTWITFILLIVYTYYSPLSKLQLNFNWRLSKELVIFSLPLYGAQILNEIIGWTNILLLGIIQSTEEVALYNASLRIGTLMTFPLTAAVFLYLPTATRLHFKGTKNNIQDLYVNTSRWIAFFILPITLFIVFDGSFLIKYLFGDAYLESANVLKCLAVGFSVNTLLGPNAATLISFGKTKTVFYSTAIGVFVAVIISFTFIPVYGALGAAIGTSTALIFSNMYKSIMLYTYYKIHPFTIQYRKPLLFSVITNTFIYSIIWLSNLQYELLHFIILLLFMFVSFISPFITKSLTDSDISLLNEFEQRYFPQNFMVKKLLHYIQPKIP